MASSSSLLLCEVYVGTTTSRDAFIQRVVVDWVNEVKDVKGEQTDSGEFIRI